MTVDRELSEHDLNTAASIARLEAKVEALIVRFDEAITTQVKDHGKRLVMRGAKTHLSAA